MYLEKFEKALKNTVENKAFFQEQLNKIITIFEDIKKEKKQLFFIGNGGSAGIAVHMTADYLKNGGIKTHNMLEPCTITCLANDYGYEHVFSKQLEIIAEEGDLLVAISSSGNSCNIVNAVTCGKKIGCKVITFSGFCENNKLRKLGLYNIYVPSMEYGVVESIHNLILQQIVDEIIVNKNKK